MDKTLGAAISDIFQGLTIPGPSATGPTPSQGAAASAEVKSLIAQANQDFQQAESDLKAGNFSAYGTDITSLQTVLQELQQASGASSSSTPSANSTSTTTTTTTTTGTLSARR
jgi:hypothetical protein